MKLCYIKFGAKFINIFFSMKLKNIPRIRESVKGFCIEHTFLDNIIDLATNKTIRQNACITHTVSGKNNTIFLCNSDCFRQSFQFIFCSEKVIHRTEQQSDVIGIILKHRQIHSIALGDGNCFAGSSVLLKNFNVVFNEFHRIHTITLLSQSMTIATCCGSDF